VKPTAAVSRLFITSTGTAAGKTFVTRALSRALCLRGQSPAALKPIETGCTPAPLDAQALARAACDISLADAGAFYRAADALSPYAIELVRGTAQPDLPGIVTHARTFESTHSHILVEGAGGLLVPLSATLNMADLAQQLGYPLMFVAEDRLGVLSHLLSAIECARTRHLGVAAIVLTQLQPESADSSCPTNARILRELTALPVFAFPHERDDDGALAAAAERSGLMTLLI
jgi:dethiobiotin synthetase